MRLAHLRDLRHPLSVDLWIDRVAAHAKVILVRLLGGLDWWRYGIERLSALARERAIVLAVLPGEDRDDPRLADASTLPPQELDALLSFFREGGRENLRALLRRLARHAGRGSSARSRDRCRATPAICRAKGRSISVSLCHRSRRRGGGADHLLSRLLLAADTAPIDALCDALSTRGLARRRSCHEPQGSRRPPSLSATRSHDSPRADHHDDGFRRPRDIGEPTPLDGPAYRAAGRHATTQRAAWCDSARGLGAADLAMHVVLPELDGRVLAGAVAFKHPLPPHEGLAFTALASRRSRIALPWSPNGRRARTAAGNPRSDGAWRS